MESVHFYEELARWSEVVGGFAFVVVMVVLFRRLLLPAVAAAAVARNAELVNAERRREQLRADVSAARAELEAATSEGLLIRERGLADAQREHDRIIEEARHEGTRLLVNARGELERGRLAARDRLRIELIEKALGRARAIATERLDPATNARLVARTVDELAERRPLMPNETLARRYATAIFQLASEAGAVDRVGTDLHAFVAALEKDDAVRRFFVAPIVDRQEKTEVIASAFAALHPVALHSVLLLVQKRRGA